MISYSVNGSQVSGVTCANNVGFVGLHIGAGKHNSKYHLKYKKLCKFACRQGVRLLKEGKSAVRVAEEVTMLLEDSPLTNAGLGSNLTWDGRIECDASIMDGATLQWGAVGAVPCVKNPICLARRLCEKQGTSLALGRVPPCLLVGHGAKKWAVEAGLKVVPSKKLISARALKTFHHYKKRVRQYESITSSVLTPLDTVGVVCLDRYGTVASACSSGGLALKHSGRVGQAAAYGSGVWAENGDISLAACTSGCGEHLLRTMFAKEAVECLKTTSCPTSALYGVMKTHFLESRFLNGVEEKLGGIAMLRVESGVLGEFLWAHTSPTMCVGYMTTSDVSARCRISSLPTDTSAGSKIIVEGFTFKIKLKADMEVVDVPGDTETLCDNE